MQLPIIALIVIVSMFYRKTNDLNGKSSIHLLNFRRNPLGFMSLALAINFISIFIAIIHTLNPFDEKFFYRTVLVLDVSTAFCFLVQVTPFVIYDYARRSFSNSREVYDKANIYFFLLILSGFIVLLNWHGQQFNWEDYRLSFYIYDFFIYLLVGYYSLMRFKINNSKSVVNSNKYVCNGFLLWAFVQLVPILKFFSVPKEYIDVMGYCGSAMGKLLILYGLYHFSLSMVKNFTQKLADHNNKLKSLQIIINEISNCDSISVLTNKICKHVTDKNGVFGFDYAIIASVDYLRGKIQYQSSWLSNDKIQTPDLWIEKIGIPISHHDIVAVVAREKKPIFVDGYYVDYRKVDLNAKQCCLNKHVFIEFAHEDLNRILLPIMNSKIVKEETNPVAVLEMGYHISASKSSDDILEDNEFSLYLDNCSQAYHRLVSAHAKQSMFSIITNADVNSRDNHFLFLEEILESVCTLLATQVGFFVTIPINLTTNDVTVIFSKSIADSNKTKNNVEAFFRRYLKVNDAENSYFEIYSLEKELLRFFKCSHMLHQAVKLNGSTAGVIIILREGVSTENDLVAETIKGVLCQIPQLYNEKLFHNSVAALVNPGDIISDVEINIQPVIESIQQYFGTSQTVLFLKDVNGDYNEAYSSSAQRNPISTVKDFTVNIESEHYFIKVEKAGQSNGKSLISQAIKMHARSILVKPIVTQHKEYGFIAIFFKNLPDLLYEDISFLSLVSVKALANLQLQSLIAAFRNVSDTFSQNNLKTTLRTITDHAMDLLNADPVILFKTNNGKDVYFKDATYSNREDFFDLHILELFHSRNEQPVELAEIIVQTGSKYFESHTDYTDFILKHARPDSLRKSNHDFWTREKIGSMAAIRLTTKIGNIIKVVGVLFINFRVEIKFHNDLQRLIETFGSFPSGSIANGVILEKNRLFILNNFKLSRPIFQEQLTAFNLHNAKKLFSALDSSLEKLELIANNRFDTPQKKISGIIEQLPKIKDVNDALEKKFNEIDKIYKPSDRSTFRNINIVHLIKVQLDLLDSEIKKKFITVHTDFFSDEVVIFCDDAPIGVSILNIINNAYQAVGLRGKIDIKVTEQRDNKIKIDIIDNGKGINKDLQNFIFEPYVTDKPDGSGLGLPMSKFFVEQVHNGFLRCDSKNGLTTFSIILPRNLEKQKAPKQKTLT